MKKYRDVIDLTGAAKLAAGETRNVVNTIGRIPDLITIDMVSGNTRLTINTAGITVAVIPVTNPSPTEANESRLVVEAWHSQES